jgi:hypothetical protein
MGEIMALSEHTGNKGGQEKQGKVTVAFQVVDF